MPRPLEEVNLPVHKGRDVVQPLERRVERSVVEGRAEWNESRVAADECELAETREVAINSGRAPPLTRLDERERFEVWRDDADKLRDDAVVLLVQSTLSGPPELCPPFL